MGVLGGTLEGTLNLEVRDDDLFNEPQARSIFITAEPITAYQPVALVGGKVERADYNDINHLNRIIGLAIESVSLADKEIIVALGGIVENNTWTFATDDQLFVGSDGAIITTPGSGLYLNKIGVAINSTKINIKVNQSIKRT